jgi:hypothetical protein
MEARVSRADIRVGCRYPQSARLPPLSPDQPSRCGIAGTRGSLLANHDPADSQGWRRALEKTGLFTTLVLTESDCEVDVGVDGFVALVGSWGWIADLPGKERVAVLGAVRELVGASATVTVRHHTEICAARRSTG